MLVSDFPDILWNAFFGQVPEWLVWIKAGLLAFFFGLAHYLYGSPSGVIGFLMTGFLAWLLGKSMLETRGLFWAWFIHFLADVIIFASYAIS